MTTYFEPRCHVRVDRALRVAMLVTFTWTVTATVSADEPRKPQQAGAVAVASPAIDRMLGNRWVQLRQDPVGARRGSSFRYAPDAGAFFLWGFMNADYGFLQELPLMDVPEYDMVSFKPGDDRWRGHLPRAWASQWKKRLPQAFVPRTYAGIISGSERTLLRSPSNSVYAAPRPDLNIAFNQVAYRAKDRSLYYFTGGLTARYDIDARQWHDLTPRHSPPPVSCGSLAYNPMHDELVLFGGGHVAERRADGRIVGYTGTWIYSFENRDWRRLETPVEPPPRMDARLVTAAGEGVMVVFAGDGQSHYLADTWRFDLKERTWSKSTAAGPPPRAGHFAVYDQATGWVIIGGGYDRKDRRDMWAYDIEEDRWRRVAGEVPTGFFMTADIAPESRLILLTTNTRTPGDEHICDTLFPVRTTYAYRVVTDGLVVEGEPRHHKPLAKQPPEESVAKKPLDVSQRAAHQKRLLELPVNEWVPLPNPARSAPTRTWGSATFDVDRGRILYWGGGHCGYGGNDVDMYVVAEHTWPRSRVAPEFPERIWNHGVRPAGVTFGGGPWTTHGRKFYAYDPLAKTMVMVRPIQLTTGYVPEALADFPGEPRIRLSALVNPPASYKKYVTWSFDIETAEWDIVGPAPVGLDTMVTTPKGVVGLRVDWSQRLNDAGYLLPPKEARRRENTALFRWDGERRTWQRLDKPNQPAPSLMYEMTSLCYDQRRDRVLVHGAGVRRDELWALDMKSGLWTHLQPRVVAKQKTAPPVCRRDVIYLPLQDVVVTFGADTDNAAEPGFWVYDPRGNTWHRMPIAAPPGVDPRRAGGENRALVYDAERDLLLLVLGTSGNKGKATLHAMRYEHRQATGTK